MHPYERDVLPQRGPHFYREGGEVMFKFVLDITNVIGPRRATVNDVRQHGEAFQALAKADGPFSEAEMATIGFVKVEATPALEVRPVVLSDGQPAEYRRYEGREEINIPPLTGDVTHAATLSELPKRRGRPPKVTA